MEKKKISGLGFTSALVGAVLGLYALVLFVWIIIAGAFTDDALKQAMSPNRIFTNINNPENTDYANSLANAGTILGITNILVFVLFAAALIIGIVCLISVLTKGPAGLAIGKYIGAVGVLLAVVAVSLWFAVATTLNEGLGILGFRYSDDGFGIFNPVAAIILIVGLLAFTVLAFLSSTTTAPAAASEPAASYQPAPADAGYQSHSQLPEQTAVYDAPSAYQPAAAYDSGYAPGHSAGDSTRTTALPGDAVPDTTYAAPESGADAEETREVDISSAPAGGPPAPAAEPEPAPSAPAAPAAPAPGSQRPFARADGEYYLQIGGAEYGPYTAAQIAEYADEGRINENTQIRPAQGYYEAASVVPGLFT